MHIPGPGNAYQGVILLQRRQTFAQHPIYRMFGVKKLQIHQNDFFSLASCVDRFLNASIRLCRVAILCSWCDLQLSSCNFLVQLLVQMQLQSMFICCKTIAAVHEEAMDLVRRKIWRF